MWGILVAIVFMTAQTIVVLWILGSRNARVLESEVHDLYAAIVHDGYVVSVATLVTAVVCCALIAGIIKLKKHARIGDYLALRAVPWRTILQWLLLLAGLIVVADVMTVLLERSIVPEFMSEVYTTAKPAWLLWIALLVGAPLFEETFFRGFLFRGFASSLLGTTGTVLVTSGLWALMHVQYDAQGIALVFVLGLLLGAARARTGSLLAPLIMHSAANLVATIETALTI